MSETTAALEYPEAVVRRVTPADLNEIGPWLIGRFQERHPNASPQQILGWLRGSIYSNDRWFVRTDHACAMAELRRVPLEAYPDAIEMFCFAESDEWRHEAADLYQTMAKWAANLEATNLEVDIWTDCSRQMIATRLGSLASKRTATISLWPDR